MIRIGARLGLVETEPTTPESRAYVRAHEGVHWLRSHLNGCRVREVASDRVCFRKDGLIQEIVFENSQLTLTSPEPNIKPGLSDRFFFDPTGQPTFELGAGGFVQFEHKGDNLKAILEATDDTLGQVGRHKAQISFVAPREQVSIPGPSG